MTRPIAAGAALALLLAVPVLAGPARAQAPAGAPPPAQIEGELTLITPISKFIHDASLKAFAEHAKEKWNVTVKVNAIPAGTPVAYGRIVEWKGKPEVDIFWGGEPALVEKLADQKPLQKVESSRHARGVVHGVDVEPEPPAPHTKGD